MVLQQPAACGRPTRISSKVIPKPVRQDGNMVHSFVAFVRQKVPTKKEPVAKRTVCDLINYFPFGCSRLDGFALGLGQMLVDMSSLK
jgi:hypothetical protein